VKRAEHEVAGRSQTDDEDAGFRISKARNRASPILLGGEGASALPGNLLAPRNEPRAKAAIDQLLRERGER
jgi:hypothetical protein